jgi:Flp pilus assembly pilin Flp
MITIFRRLWQDEAGMTTVEYALLLALLTIASIAAWSTLGQRKTMMLELVTERMAQ